MKIITRILLFLAIIISVLWIEAVYADMSGPELREFGIVVVNPDGEDYYDYKGNVVGHLNKDEMVIVIYEYEGKYSIASTEVGAYGGHNTLGYINDLDGFSIVTEEVDPTKYPDDSTITKYDTPQKAKINTPDGVDIYSGPSSVYKKVGHIKNETALTFQYSTQGTHIYVEYNGVKGWVEILKAKVLIENDTQYIFSDQFATACGFVPKNSIVTPTYKTDRWTHQALFEYNGCEFMHNTLKDEEVFSIYPYNRVPKKDVSIYEYADTSSTVLGTIPAGTEVTTLAASDSFYDENVTIYVEYNGVRGWIIEDINDISFSSSIEPEEKPIVEDTIEIQDVVTPSNYEKKPTYLGISLGLFVLLCAFGVGLLVITALVIIILVNRSKTSKKEEPKVVKETNEQK